MKRPMPHELDASGGSPLSESAAQPADEHKKPEPPESANRLDAELRLMGSLNRELMKLDEKARARVLSYFIARYFPHSQSVLIKPHVQESEA